MGRSGCMLKSIVRKRMFNDFFALTKIKIVHSGACSNRSCFVEPHRAPFEQSSELLRGGSVFGENSPGHKWAQETCAGCPQQRYIPGEPVNVHIMFHDTSHIKRHEVDCY